MAYVTARRLLSNDAPAEVEASVRSEATAQQPSSEEAPLAIRGTAGMGVSFARCCNPIPGDPSVGFITSGKGMRIHQETCSNLAEHRGNSEQILHLTRDTNVSGARTVDLRPEWDHQRRRVAQLPASITGADASIDKISVDERDGKISVVQLTLRVRGRLHLSQLIKRIRALQGVVRLTRLKN